MRWPQMMMREKVRMRPIFEEIISCMDGQSRCITPRARGKSHMCAGIKALSAVAGVEEEGLIALNGGKLVSQALDLEEPCLA
jgi:hypothetical protein